MNEALTAILLLVAFLAGVFVGVLFVGTTLSRVMATISTLEEGRDRTGEMATFWKGDYEG